MAMPTDKVQAILENWIMDLAARNIKGTSIRVKIAHVELFLDVNRVLLQKNLA